MSSGVLIGSFLDEGGGGVLQTGWVRRVGGQAGGWAAGRAGGGQVASFGVTSVHDSQLKATPDISSTNSKQHWVLQQNGVHSVGVHVGMGNTPAASSFLWDNCLVHSASVTRILLW